MSISAASRLFGSEQLEIQFDCFDLPFSMPK